MLFFNHFPIPTQALCILPEDGWQLVFANINFLISLKAVAFSQKKRSQCGRVLTFQKLPDLHRDIRSPTRSPSGDLED